MDTLLEDGFVVYLRLESTDPYSPEAAEQAVVHCSSYAEARQVRRRCHDASRECVIRYTGPAGGGD